jgi:hypothetical protein
MAFDARKSKMGLLNTAANMRLLKDPDVVDMVALLEIMEEGDIKVRNAESALYWGQNNGLIRYSGRMLDLLTSEV